jgi:hypothetical protein
MIQSNLREKEDRAERVRCERPKFQDVKQVLSRLDETRRAAEPSPILKEFMIKNGFYDKKGTKKDLFPQEIHGKRIGDGKKIIEK